MKERILVVEDDESICLGLVDTLRAKGYEVRAARTGAEAIEAATSHPPRLVILDVMLPDFDGFEVCTRLKRKGGDLSKVPIIMLTARGSEIDKVRGLELGADDYVTKPFSLMELLARVEAVLRRVRRTLDVLAFGNVSVDFAREEVSKGGRSVELPHRAFELLRALAQRSGEVVTRDELLSAAWGYESYPNTRTVDNHIVKLRKAIEDEPDRPAYILTVHGKGYRLKIDG